MPSSPDFNNQPTPTTKQSVPSRKTEFGPIIGIIIILVILVSGACYVGITRLNRSSLSASAASSIPSGTTTLPDVNE